MNFKCFIATDIDGTLLKEGKPTKGLDALTALLAAHKGVVGLVYATGRSIDSTLELVHQKILPEPDAIAPFVGTEIWFPKWGALDARYDEKISTGWNYDEILFWAKEVFQLELQEETFQSERKLSFYLDRHSKVFDFEKFLTAKKIQARVVYSCSQFLDIIPRGAGKANAVKYLSWLWNIPLQKVLTCGDSGNDIDMLTCPYTCNVAVGNLENELKQLQQLGRFYTSKHIFAKGVLEGAEAFNFWPDYSLSSTTSVANT